MARAADAASWDAFNSPPRRRQRLPCRSGQTASIKRGGQYFWCGRAILLPRRPSGGQAGGVGTAERGWAVKTPKRKSMFGSLASSWLNAEIDWDLVLRIGNPWFDRMAAHIANPHVPNGEQRSTKSTTTGRKLRRRQAAGERLPLRYSATGARPFPSRLVVNP